jgi:predicted transcriptional regulator YheO
MFTNIIENFIFKKSFTQKILSMKLKAVWGKHHATEDDLLRKQKRTVAVYADGKFLFNKHAVKDAAISLNLSVTTVFRYLNNKKPLKRNNTIYEFKDINLE